MNLRLPAVAAVIVAAGAVAAYRAFHQEPVPPVASIAAGSSVAATSVDTAPAVPAGTQAPQPRRTGARVTVYVAGAVIHAGVYALPAASRGIDALHAAGGARGDADLVAVNLAQPLEDGEEIVVPVIGTDPPSASASARRSRRAQSSAGAGTVQAAHRKRSRKHRKRHAVSAGASSGDASGATYANVDPATAANADPPTETVDLNTADENELETLPGIGALLASRIVMFREINGPFSSPDDLLDVGGMTQGRLDAIEPYVTAR